MHRKPALVTLSICLTIAAGALVARGGPLDPPGGPVAPTFKTLNQVEPRVPISPQTTPGDADSLYKITQAGTYYLTGNLNGVTGKYGIEVGVGNVTIDLMGHSMIGFDFGGPTLDAIRLTSQGDGLVVRNGSIYLWAGSGVYLTQATSCLVESVAVNSCQNVGINVGNHAIVRGCVVGTCGTGFNAGTDAVFDDCTAFENAGLGFSVAGGAAMSGCTARDNGSYGFFGNGSIAGCVADSNGFATTDSGYTWTGTITDSTAFGNAEHGFNVLSGAVLRGCLARQNHASGFHLDSAQVVDCVAHANDVDGFTLTFNTTITSCTADANGNAGILASSGGNRIESNSVNANAYGLRITGTNNFIVRNTARSNSTSNFNILAGNNYAQILNSPGSGFASSNAWANFAY